MRALLALLVLIVSVPANLSASEQSPRELIEVAQAYYWFGMEEQGNVDAYDYALSLLDEADRLLIASANTEGIDRLQINALRGDIREQKEVAHDTLFGVFPLTRLYGRSLFADSLSAGTFEVLDDPKVMASTAAVRKVIASIADGWKSRPQLDAVFSSVPENEALENEALYLFNENPRFYVHGRGEVIAALPRTERFEHDVAEFELGILPPATRVHLFEKFGADDLLHVVVTELNTRSDDAFYKVRGNIYHRDLDPPQYVTTALGLSRDRREVFWPLILIQCGMFVSALTVAAGVIYRRQETLGPALVDLWLICAAFIVGRITPWILMPLIATVRPVPETLAIVSFWYPGLAALIAVVVPVVVVRIVSAGLGRRISPLLYTDRRGDAIACAVGFGGAAYLIVSCVLYDGPAGYQVAIPLAIGCATPAWMLGRTLDPKYRNPIFGALVPTLFVFLLGVLFATAEASYLWAAALLGGPAFLLLSRQLRRTGADVGGGRIGPGESDSDTPETLEELARAASQPQFREFPIFDQAIDKMSGLTKGTTTALVIRGPSGSGKSALIAAVTREIRARLSKAGQSLVVLPGACQQGSPTASAPPLAPIQRALGAHLDVDLFGIRSDDAGAHAALDDAYEIFLGPLATFLSSGASAERSPVEAGSREALFSMGARAIRDLVSKHATVLVIDDAQWIDADSFAFLQRVLEELPVGGQRRFALVLATQDTSGGVADRLGIGRDALSFRSLSESESTGWLEGYFGLDESSARRLDAWLRGPSGEVFVGPLLEALGYVAREGLVERSDADFSLREGYRDHPPLEAVDRAREALRKMTKWGEAHELALTFAALYGREFPISIVAAAIGQAPLAVARDFDRVERETGLIADPMDNRAVYRFRSQVLLDAVRRELRLYQRTSHAPLRASVRECHARLASVIREIGEEDLDSLLRAAQHFHRAGSLWARESLTANIRAARFAQSRYFFDRAEGCLVLAEEAAKTVNEPFRVAQEWLILESAKAHVTGAGTTEAAERGWNLVTARDEIGKELSLDCLLAMARLFYEQAATGEDTSTWASRAEAIASEITGRASSEGRAEVEADGLHYGALARFLDGAPLPVVASELEEAAAKARATGTTGLKALARITTSLGFVLMRDPTRSSDARSWLEKSIPIKKQLGDMPGLARSHGGLAYLALDAKDLSQARHNGRENARISEQLGDQRGLSKAHSVLAACDRLGEQYPEAEQNYHLALRWAENDIDRGFALAGLLHVHASTGCSSGLMDCATKLATLASATHGHAPWFSNAKEAIAAMKPPLSEPVLALERLLGNAP